MKLNVLLNSRISSVIAEMGHTDQMTVCDAGLPIPAGVERIDLAVKAGLPRFMDVLQTILKELCIEKVLIAEELKSENPEGFQEIKDKLDEYTETSGYSVRIELVPHAEFKTLTSFSKAIVRTGEVKPYMNIILYSGVVF